MSDFKVGDAVYGILPTGWFAEYAIASAGDLARKPFNLDFVQAAALPLGALTAWQALFDLAKLSDGQRLLITNSSGGVGSLAVQLAKTIGAHVTAMGSAPNEAYIRGLGADEFIDYRQQRFEDVAHDMDAVFDTVGGETFDRAFLTLKRAAFCHCGGSQKKSKALWSRFSTRIRQRQSSICRVGYVGSDGSTPLGGVRRSDPASSKRLAFDVYRRSSTISLH
ncbi:NADP-dependent oxidoreductase [Agrobacterium sp. SORGH_AS 787]|uniref:NADP-dependent oxidoreductase n=1 Tax=Agrobacterium sp. SORGH_AS 787 TaxID=3041775 RepID=UPI002785D821|nr:NADPH:quinone reductase-like Zn-dependent oxidoreductase [Rhizobium sp. SORGH_AS_0787]